LNNGIVEEFAESSIFFENPEKENLQKFLKKVLKY